MSDCDGVYERRSGRGFLYKYRACWTRTPSGSVVFDSTVRREDLIIVQPRGLLNDVIVGDEEVAVIKAIELAVERSVIE
jgi:hypothetical protein